MASKDQMLAAPQKYLTAFQDQDLEAILALYADDAVVEDPVGSDKHVGIDAIRAFYSGAMGAKVQAELTGPVRLAGQEAAFPFTITVMGANLAIDIIDVFRFNDDGKVVEMRAFWGDTNHRTT